MEIPSEAVWLRIFIGGSDKAGGRPLYRVTLEKVRVIAYRHNAGTGMEGSS